jgi:hypothetical protein
LAANGGGIKYFYASGEQVHTQPIGGSKAGASPISLANKERRPGENLNPKGGA